MTSDQGFLIRLLSSKRMRTQGFAAAAAFASIYIADCFLFAIPTAGDTHTAIEYAVATQTFGFIGDILLLYGAFFFYHAIRSVNVLLASAASLLLIAFAVFMQCWHWHSTLALLLNSQFSTSGSPEVMSAMAFMRQGDGIFSVLGLPVFLGAWVLIAISAFFRGALIPRWILLVSPPLTVPVFMFGVPLLLSEPPFFIHVSAGALLLVPALILTALRTSNPID